MVASAFSISKPSGLSIFKPRHLLFAALLLDGHGVPDAAPTR
jgi:hypothetical protein